MFADSWILNRKPRFKHEFGGTAAVELLMTQFVMVYFLHVSNSRCYSVSKSFSEKKEVSYKRL